jgi:type I restriction enzyme S subunit
MTNGWQTVPLGEFLTQRKEFFTIDDFARYKRARVQSHGKGIVLRDEIGGIEIKTKKQQAARTGEFLVAEIDAKVGGFGIVPPQLDGAVVSSHYFLFQINEKKCSKDWLNWFVRYNSLEDQVKAQGSTNYAAIRPSHVLNFEIPLPPIDEQHRILGRVEGLAVRIAKAKFLRNEADIETDSLEHSCVDQVYKSCAANFGTSEFASICDTITDGDHITPRFSDSGVKFIFVGNVSSGFLHFKNCKHVLPEYYAKIRPQRRAQVGDILYSAVGATLGIPAIVDQSEEFCFQRHIAIIKPNRSKLDSKFLWHMLRSTTVFEIAWANITGTAQPTVPLNAIRRFPIPVPPLDEQRRIVAYLDSVQARLASLRELQSATGEELSALLPSVLDRAFKGEL